MDQRRVCRRPHDEHLLHLRRFRAGGDSRFGFVCDIIAMWAVFVPLGFIAAFVWNLPPLWVYLILSCDEFAKMPVVYFRYRQKKWLRNITKEVTA